MVDVPALDSTPSPRAGRRERVACPRSQTRGAQPARAGRRAAQTGESDDISVGDVTLSRSLWTILCDEADQHVATLEHELSILQFDPKASPRAGMVRASHTLCGIHRTGGFPLVATTAKGLEQALIGLEQRGAPMPSTAYPVLARAIAGLAVLVGRVKAQAAFSRADVTEAQTIQARARRASPGSGVRGRRCRGRGDGRSRPR